jgi:hypothetical protein
MPPEGASKAPRPTRILNGVLEQECGRCQNWFEKAGPSFKAARSNKIVDTCKRCRHNITKGRRDRNQALVAGPSNAEPSSSTGSTIVVDTGLSADVPIPAAASIASRAGTVYYAKMSSYIY